MYIYVYESSSILQYYINQMCWKVQKYSVWRSIMTWHDSDPTVTLLWPCCDPRCYLRCEVGGADWPDGDEQDHEQWEYHLHVGDGVHAEGAQQQQLQDLQEGEVVDLPLGHFADVVGGRVRRLQRGGTRAGQRGPTNQPANRVVGGGRVHSHGSHKSSSVGRTDRKKSH